VKFRRNSTSKRPSLLKGTEPPWSQLKNVLRFGPHLRDPNFFFFRRISPHGICFAIGFGIALEPSNGLGTLVANPREGTREADRGPSRN